jgi:GntR family transcriptional regulator
LEILISTAKGQPIYNQIYAQIKAGILSGQLHEGDLLPSIRALAKDLRISVITTKRAYDELEQDGFLYTVAGKGCFVAKKNTERIREENLKQIEELMLQIAPLAASCGLTTDDLTEMYRVLIKEE